MWIAWAVSWLGAAWWSGATEKRVGMRREIGYRAVLLIGAILFGIPARSHDGGLRLWYAHRAGAWLCLAVTLGGFAFCWWGRLHLGRLWSGQITRKEGHRVVDTGPYGIVRHPIYTGILVAVFATIAANGTSLGIAGGFLLAIGLWMKARLEERWLRTELGAAYDAYRRRVPMLVPFGPRG
jgi:protein-S-isoprenylcysteine O-methyltransferase Ste14